MSTPFQIYRNTNLGKALSESLRGLEADNELREETSKKVMDKFDEIIVRKLYGLQQQGNVELNAMSTNYNNCDDVWKFCVKSLEVRGENFRLNSDSCKIIALDVENNPMK